MKGMEASVRMTALAAFALLAASCSGGSDSPSEAASGAVSGTSNDCPVTIPNGNVPNELAGVNHGNGSLHVSIWLHGVVVAQPEDVEPDGSITAKFGWYRTVPGELAITGRRLDAKAPPLSAEIPSGYGREGFQASGVIFSSEGCWEITGTAGDATLTFVTIVLKASR